MESRALEQVERLEPDLLLTDIRMPFMSGIELAREAREICPTMQIAFLSGHDDFSYAQQAIQYNIISYMLKPISSAELTEELKRIKRKIDQRFEEFASSREQEEHGRQQEFLQPLILDAYQSSLPEREEELLKAAKNSGFLEGDTRQPAVCCSCRLAGGCGRPKLHGASQRACNGYDIREVHPLLWQLFLQ